MTRTPMSVPLSWRSSAFAFVLLAAGCASQGAWGGPFGLPTPLWPQALVRIWSGGEVQRWHAVVITEESVSGIPYQMPVTCDSCVLRIPRTQVDSMKLDHKKLNALEVVGVVGILAVGIVAEGVVCHLLDPHNGDC